MNEIIWLVLVVSTTIVSSPKYALFDPQSYTIETKVADKQWHEFDTSTAALRFVETGQAKGEVFFYKAERFHIFLSKKVESKTDLLKEEEEKYPAMCLNYEPVKGRFCALLMGHYGKHRPHEHEICLMEWE